MRISRRQHLSRGAASLEAALVGAGVEVAAPPLASLGLDVRRLDLGPADAFRHGLRQQLLAAASATPTGSLSLGKHPPTVPVVRSSSHGRQFDH